MSGTEVMEEQNAGDKPVTLIRTKIQSNILVHLKHHTNQRRTESGSEQQQP